MALRFLRPKSALGLCRSGADLRSEAVALVDHTADIDKRLKQLADQHAREIAVIAGALLKIVEIENEADHLLDSRQRLRGA